MAFGGHSKSVISNLASVFIFLGMAVAPEAWAFAKSGSNVIL